MTTFNVFLFVIVGHFVGDFVLQSNWMAQNKSKDSVALILHCFVYTATIFVAFVIGASVLHARVGTGDIIIWAFFNFILHLGTDMITSVVNSRLWEEKRAHAFFVGVGADQLIHYMALGLTLKAAAL